MPIIKCKMCGGDIELAADKTFGTCEYCGSTMTFPKVSDDQRAAAFNRGNHFRRIGEFDKALSVYEHIVADDDADAEAHWCCALCRFGIEYVEDPTTYEWLPTCHRASFDSFLEDVDYLAAVEHSDGITRRQYQKDAAKIAEVQRGILATSQNTEPYDVFISYKELDADGNRTRDSILAQDIYYRLTEKGWRVFFSRISLEDVPGTQYEPYIFAALNSAKVMIVVGTSAENLNAVWVKNEWSRFLAMMRKDRTKLLIPCYRDMDPYDLPEQLSVLMSYDMGRIGFIQDLIRGVDKVLTAEKKEPVKETVVVQQGEGTMKTAAAVKRGRLALEESNWEQAKEYFEQALTFDAECAEAYFGMALAKAQCRTAEEYMQRAVDQVPGRNTLVIPRADAHIQRMVEQYTLYHFLDQNKIEEYYCFDLSYPSDALGWNKICEKEKHAFENNRNISLAYRFAKGPYRETLERFKNALYDALEANVQKAEQEKRKSAEQKEAKYKDFLEITDKQIEELHQQKLVEIENVYLGLCKEFESVKTSYACRSLKDRFLYLGGYKDCEEYVKKCNARILELEQKEREEQEEKRKEKLYNTYAKVFGRGSVVDGAIRSWDAANWAAAKAGFESLGDYRDAPACAQKCTEAIEQIKRENEAKVRAAAEKAERRRREEAEEAERQRILAEKAAAEKKAKQKKSGIIAGILAAVAIAAVLIVTMIIIPKQKYTAAVAKYGQEFVDSFYALNVGDTFIFGTYEQDNNTSNGKEDIEWLVLAEEGNRKLLISKYALDCQQYNTLYESVTWETCSLRRWLNGRFLNAAFSEKERAMIPSVTVIAHKNPKYNTDPGNSTMDRIFLLSITEANQNFGSDEARKCTPTKFAIAQGAETKDNKDNKDNNYSWWLRSPGYYPEYAAGVTGGGSINDSSVGNVNYAHNTVRPALWISIEP